MEKVGDDPADKKEKNEEENFKWMCLLKRSYKTVMKNCLKNYIIIHMLVEMSTLPLNQELLTYWSVDMVKYKVSLD